MFLMLLLCQSDTYLLCPLSHLKSNVKTSIPDNFLLHSRHSIPFPTYIRECAKMEMIMRHDLGCRIFSLSSSILRAQSGEDWADTLVHRTNQTIIFIYPPLKQNWYSMIVATQYMLTLSQYEWWTYTTTLHTEQTKLPN